MGPALPPPHRAQESFHLWEVWGWQVEAVPLLPLLSGCWPFKAAGCQGLSWGDPKGRVWSGTRGPFSCCCCLRAAHRLAWGGRQGGG